MSPLRFKYSERNNGRLFDAVKNVTAPALRQSATFAMSLGAKELFHTNFLAFIMESQDERLEPVQLAVREKLGFEKTEEELSFCLVWREKRNLDLIIVPLKIYHNSLDGAGNIDDKKSYEVLPEKIVVVEAKLKSIPTPNQFERYNKMLKKGVNIEVPRDLPYALFRGNNELKSISISKGKAELECKRILLSPRECIPSSSNYGWTYVGWEGIVDALEEGLKGMSESALKSIVADYKDSLRNILSVLSWVNQEFQEFTGPKGDLRFSSVINRMKGEPLLGLRIHDMTGKYFYSLLESCIRNAANSYIDCNDSSWEFNSYTSYSNMNPMIGFEWRYIYSPAKGRAKELALSMGVQIQGHIYRHFISVGSGFPQLEKSCSDDKYLWSWFLAKPNNYIEEAGVSMDNFPVFEGIAVDKNSNLCRDLGIQGKLPGKLKNRLTNLKVFDDTKFLYSSFDCGDCNYIALKEHIIKSIRFSREIVLKGCMDEIIESIENLK